MYDDIGARGIEVLVQLWLWELVLIEPIDLKDLGKLCKKIRKHFFFKTTTNISSGHIHTVNSNSVYVMAGITRNLDPYKCFTDDFIHKFQN